MWQYVGHALQMLCMWNSSCELDRSATRVTRLEARPPENYYLSLGEIGIIFLSVLSRQSLGQFSLLSNMQRAIWPGVKEPECNADLDIVIRTRNDWKCASTRRPNQIMGCSASSPPVTLVLCITHVA
jgi:hypothetical protein